MQRQNQSGNVLTPDDLWEVDEDLLDILQTGRGSGEPWGFVTPETAHKRLQQDFDRDVQVQYVQQRLTRLAEHNHVEKVNRGVYRFVSDPREGDDA